MVNPRAVAGGDHDMFVCGNDAVAKEVVTGILKEFGWSHITDLGDLTAARAMEMYLPLWLRLWGALENGMFNIRIVR
jgi:predicted dinucleotide-binding enzyme